MEKYNSRLQSKELDELFGAILSLKDLNECYRFFEDLCTVGEIKAIAQRLEVAKLLSDNITYNEISQTTGASTATISRVNRALNYGANGYSLILNQDKNV